MLLVRSSFDSAKVYSLTSFLAQVSLDRSSNIQRQSRSSDKGAGVLVIQRSQVNYATYLDIE